MENKYNPFLFYVVFGADAEKLEVSRKKHHVDGFPEGLTLQQLQCQQNEAYMEEFLSGTIERLLQQQLPTLYEACRNTTEWVIIRGEITENNHLDYLKNTIGIIQALIEQGATGVLDLLTIDLASASDWTSQYFNQEIIPQKHVIILNSDEENDCCWLHTRGMIKFGCPDFSISQVSKTSVNEAAKAINKLISLSVEGKLSSDSICLHTADGKTFEAQLEFIPDFENFDFNNAYYKVTLKAKGL